MSRLKLRENGVEKGTYTEESIAFGTALWEAIEEAMKQRKLKQARVLNEPVEQFEGKFPQGEN